MLWLLYSEQAFGKGEEKDYICQNNFYGTQLFQELFKIHIMLLSVYACIGTFA